MGCASSKRVDAAAVPYRPAPTSLAVFDINTIEEPWLKHLNNTTPLPQDNNKPSLPAPILHKLNLLDATDAPQSWDEISKTLQDLKPPSTSPQQQPQPPQKTLVDGEGVALPRVFVKGRYVGGLEELVELNETGRLGRILNATRVERGIGRQTCGGCGGARFVPCFDCAGSCKLLHRERCPNCNENGLVHCPACIS
ncbi:Hypothetical protein glysoja_017582 [Glycine soja]|nr:Hypothetical protein glysoja_017582 [Glycine soja]